MDWKKDTRQMALDAATLYYDNVLSKGKYPGEFNMYKNKRREDAIVELAKKYVDKLRWVVPEYDYNEDFAKRVAALDLGSVEKYMFEFGEEPFAATRKVNMDRDVVDKWYSWSPKEVEHYMYQFGYDPAIEGDKQDFLAEVGEYQKAHDRGKIVKETMDDADVATKLGFLTVPSMYNEAMKQSLTGQFDDDRMDRAALTDLGVGGAMAVAPMYGAIARSPVAIGAIDAGLEALRQGANYMEGREVDPMAPVTAGTMAAFVPGMAKGAQTFAKKGGSLEAKPFARGIGRGARGVADPVKEERNTLKQLLIDAKRQSDYARAGMDPSKGKFVGAGAVEDGDTWQNAAAKLKAFGYTDKELLAETKAAKDVAKAKYMYAENKLNSLDGDMSISGGEKAYLRVKYGQELQQAEKEFNQAMDAYLAASMPAKTATKKMGSVQDVIGRDPARVKRTSPKAVSEVQGTGNPLVDIMAKLRNKRAQNNELEAVLKSTYDKAQDFSGMATQEGRKAVLDEMKKQFPAKMEKEIGLDNGKKLYNLGLVTGRTLNALGTSMEPNTKISPWAVKQYDQKLKSFKESEWFKKLPKEKKNAIEKALKGED
jgi:hypothetical protein